MRSGKMVKISNENRKLRYRYNTYLYYMMALDTSIRENAGANDPVYGVLEKMAATPSFQRISAGNRQRGLVGSLLRSSWSSEMAVYTALDHTDEDSAAIMLPWTYVQIYYCLHDLFEAVFLSLGCHSEQAVHHERFLKRYADFVASRQILPEPWSAILSGKACDCRGLTFDPKVKVNAQKWTNGCDSNERVYQLLSTTHKERLAEKKSEVVQTTLMHFLYRLRCRTNYRDVDPYLFDLRNRSIRDEMTGGLRTILASSMALGEGIVAASQGIDTYCEEVGRMSSWIGKPNVLPLLGRRIAIKEIVG